ncbi:hypothetical protein [Streptomyces rubiginosohelvolus]|uniref:hypothetical protein n=1 Tax=Streptomyces rubiginosohelvolus TaxID=67362 RepID=UPI0036E166A8
MPVLTDPAARLAALAAPGLVGVMLGAEVFTWVFLDGVNWATPLIAAASSPRSRTADATP